MPASNARVAQVAVPFAVPIATLNSDLATSGVVVERVIEALVTVMLAHVIVPEVVQFDV
jgi:hypothetical protein